MTRFLMVAVLMCAFAVGTGSTGRTQADVRATGSRVSCSTPDPRVPVSGAPHGLFVSNVNSPSAQPGSPTAQIIDRYLLADPTVCGADLVVPWSSIDRGPGHSPRYDWSFLQQAAAPWLAAGKMVNLIVWGAAELTSQQYGQSVTPAYVRRTVHAVQCPGANLPATPVYWEPGYRNNYRAFMRAVVARFGNNRRVGYIRFGIGADAEDYPANNLRGACAARWRTLGLTPQRWADYSLSTIRFESSLRSHVQLMVGLNSLLGSPSPTLPRAVAAAAAAHGLGFGIQGLAQGAVTSTQQGRPCYADWCALFAQYRGKVPLEVQTYSRSNPDGAGPTGALPPLLHFALTEGAQIFELYPQEWLIADDPSYPGYAAYHTVYRQALDDASTVVNTGSTGSTGFAAPSSVRVQYNVPYVQPVDTARSGDLYLPADPSGSLRPAVVVIHGGAWVGGSKEAADVRFLSTSLAAQGYVVFNINYRLVGHGGNFPGDVQDVKDAVAFLAAQATAWHIDVHRLAAVGTSAGGHLALMAGYTPDTGVFAPPHYPRSHVRLAAVGSFFGPTDMNAFPPSDAIGVQAVSRYLGGTPSQQPDAYREASPVTYATSAVPTIFEHGTADTTVPYSQSVQMSRLLQDQGTPTALVTVSGAGHGLALGRPGSARDREFEALQTFLGQVFSTVSG